MTRQNGMIIDHGRMLLACDTIINFMSNKKNAHIAMELHYVQLLKALIIFAGLRNRRLANKAQIVSEVEPVVYKIVSKCMASRFVRQGEPSGLQDLPLSEAAEAHKLMESSSHIGKILLFP